MKYILVLLCPLSVFSSFEPKIIFGSNNNENIGIILNKDQDRPSSVKIERTMGNGSKVTENLSISSNQIPFDHLNCEFQFTPVGVFKCDYTLIYQFEKKQAYAQKFQYSIDEKFSQIQEGAADLKTYTEVIANGQTRVIIGPNQCYDQNRTALLISEDGMNTFKRIPAELMWSENVSVGCIGARGPWGFQVFKLKDTYYGIGGVMDPLISGGNLWVDRYITIFKMVEGSNFGKWIRVKSFSEPKSEDPFFFIDPKTSQYYIFYDNVPPNVTENHHLAVIRVNEDFSIDDSFIRKNILSPKYEEENAHFAGSTGVVEGAKVYFINGKYLLSYSAGGYNANYKTTFAYSDSVTGPYVRLDENNRFYYASTDCSNETKGKTLCEIYKDPGHLNLVNVNGRYYFILAARPKDDTCNPASGIECRRLYINDISKTHFDKENPKDWFEIRVMDRYHPEKIEFTSKSN